MQLTRRSTVKTLLGTGGLIALRALATGLPAMAFIDPKRALAEDALRTSRLTLPPQFLILSTSVSGDPLNANVPGCYLDANIAHPTATTMAPTSLTLRGASYTAAAPWASLPQSVLDRTMFLHHATNTVTHPDEANVLRLFGAVDNHENFLGAMASSLQPALGTVQAAPIALGAQSTSEFISYQGRPQSPLTPTALASVLANPTGPLSALQSARDRDLDALNAWLKSTGNKSQQSFIDRFAQSHEQTREIADSLMSQLQAVKDNSLASQLTVALVLARMKLAPVFTVHMGFGGDNHTDTNLAGEAASHVASLAALNTFWAQLESANMQDQVTFATLNVFGRQLGKAKFSNGRGHQAYHHVMVGIGPNIKGGVYGGVQPLNGDYGALPIDSKTGQGTTGGDISLHDSLPTAGKTLGAALGVDAATLEAKIAGGTTLSAALTS